MKILATALVFMPLPVQAEPLGLALSISNDSIGEFRDRWQSSSVQAGLLWGALPNGEIPSAFGQVYEVRFRSDILTPERLDVIVPSDRRHAGVLALGLHTYAAQGRWDARLGADLVVVGPQTGLMDLQQELHRALGFTVPRLDGFEIENAARIDVSVEIARPFAFAGGTLRPFAEAQIGAEDFLRLGADWSIGDAGRLAMRAVATGQRLSFQGASHGWTVNVGGDVAAVDDSLYLPESLGYELTDLRVRLRGGLRYSAPSFEVFYGLTYLGEEFEAQREGQFVGTFQARLRF